MKIAPFKLERFFAKYEHSAPYQLCSSCCEAWTVEEVLALEPDAKEEFLRLSLGYPETLGGMRVREAIASLYRNIHPEHILVHSGSAEGIFNFMNATLDSDDHVIVHFPCYQSLFEIAKSIGCDITLWKTSPDENWELDTEFLKKSIQPNTKAVILNTPHNPTSYILSKEKQQEILEIAKKHNLLVFSDEIYRFLEYDEADTLPGACELYDNAISLGGLSKAFGLPGLRIGWVATQNRDIYNKLVAYKDYTTICHSAPSEFLAAIALRHKDKLIQRNLEIVLNNLQTLNAFFERHSELFEWRPPKAGTTGFPQLKIGQDIESFCLDLVKEQGVFLLPGSCYDYGDRHFRIGFGRRDFKQSLQQFETYLSKISVTVNS